MSEHGRSLWFHRLPDSVAVRLVMGSNYSGNEQIHRTRRYSLKLRCSPGPKTACLFFAQKCLQHEQTFRFSQTGIFNCLKIAQTKQGVSRNGDPDLVQFASGCTQPVETVSFEPEVFRFLKNSGILVPHNSRNSHLAGRTFFVKKNSFRGLSRCQFATSKSQSVSSPINPAKSFRNREPVSRDILYSSCWPTGCRSPGALKTMIGLARPGC